MSLASVAAYFLPMVNAGSAAPPTGPILPTGQEALAVPEFAEALLAYNRTLLGYTGPAPVTSPPTPNLPNWKVGLLLTIPIEHDTAANTWIVDRPKLHELATAFTIADDLALYEGAAELAIPATDDAEKAIAAVLAASTTVDVADVRTRILTNPFENVFRVVELFRQLRSGTAPWYDDESRLPKLVPFVAALCAALSDHEAGVLAQMTAGNAVLRQCQLVMDDAVLVAAARAGLLPDLSAAAELATRRKLATALGLVPVTGVADQWEKLLAMGPSVAPREPPLTPSQEVRTDKKNVYLREIILGRIVAISSSKEKQPTWSKLSHAGNPEYTAVRWLTDHKSDPDVWREIVTALTPSAAALANPFAAATITLNQVKQRLRLASRISPIEGGLDSTQLGDNGIVSYGLLQWAAHNDEELSVVWERFRAHTPEYYDLYLGMAGLLVRRWTKDATGTPAASSSTEPPEADKDAVNPLGPNPTSLKGRQLLGYFPFFVTFLKLLPGSRPERLPLPLKHRANPDAPLVVYGPRVDFFEAEKHRARNLVARARLAAFCSHDYQRVQATQAVFRFTRIEHESSVSDFRQHPPQFLSVPFAPEQEVLSADTLGTAAAGQTWTVRGTVSYKVGALLLCDREIVSVATKPAASGTPTVTTFKVVRAREGTAAAVHKAGATVRRAQGYAVLAAHVDALSTTTALPIAAGSLAQPGTDTVRLLCGKEIMACTGRSATQLTVARGHVGSVAEEHDAGAKLYRFDGDAVLTKAASIGALTITVDEASTLPVAGPYLLRCANSGPTALPPIPWSNDEVLRCTSRADNVLTVVRGAENTIAPAHGIGAVLYRVARLADLFTSDLVAAELLDVHVNQPSVCFSSIAQAIARTPGDSHDASGVLLEAWLRRFGANFLAVRAQRMENAKDRNNTLLGLHDLRPDEPGGIELGLTSDPGSFSGWEKS